MVGQTNQDNIESTLNKDNLLSGMKHKLMTTALGISLFTAVSCGDGTKPMSITVDQGEKIEHYQDFDVIHTSDGYAIQPKHGATIIVYGKSSIIKKHFDVCITTKENPDQVFNTSNGIPTPLDKTPEISILPPQ